MTRGGERIGPERAGPAGEATRLPGSARSRRRAVPALLALAVVLAACSDGAGTSSPQTSAAPAGGHGDGDVITATATGDSPCEKALRKPGPAAGDAATHGDRGMLRQKSLTRRERMRLQRQMTAAREAAARYPTAADAVAAGYGMSLGYVPCIGAHFTNWHYMQTFDPGNPSELLYDGIEPDSRIVGLSYLNYSDEEPSWFAGPNDVWHQHDGRLCVRDDEMIGGEGMTKEECEDRGGEQTMDFNEGLWMVHAWVVPGWECSWGVFAAECPELGAQRLDDE